MLSCIAEHSTKFFSQAILCFIPTALCFIPSDTFQFRALIQFTFLLSMQCLKVPMEVSDWEWFKQTYLISYHQTCREHQSTVLDILCSMHRYLLLKKRHHEAPQSSKQLKSTLALILYKYSAYGLIISSKPENY